MDDSVSRVQQGASTSSRVDVDVEAGRESDAEWAEEIIQKKGNGNKKLQRSETFAEKLQKKAEGIDAYAIKVRACTWLELSS